MNLSICIRVIAIYISALVFLNAKDNIEIYKPNLTVVDIHLNYNGDHPVLRYNHCADVSYFKGKYIAVWNANPVPKEGVDGQYIYQSTSIDFEDWSMPEKTFTSEASAVNPIDKDNQWQPVLINYKNDVLFCAWSSFTHKTTYISHTTDGHKWTNTEVLNAPDELKGKVLGFPTTHGLVTSTGTILIPCSLTPANADNVGPALTAYAAILYSEDGGMSWHWSKPIEAVSWSSIGEKKSEHNNDDRIYLWEPSVYEKEDGTIGLLIRNSTWLKKEDKPKAHRMILTTSSHDGGKTWGKARPIEVDSLDSRMFATMGKDGEGLLMVMNDMNKWVPIKSFKERLNLSLYCSPIPDPDLLLPGPLVQDQGGAAYYPAGFIRDNSLYIVYTYNSAIYGSVITPLPDFSKPFLLPRAGRPGLKIKDGIAVLSQRQSSLGLVLTESLTNAPSISLRFKARVNAYNGWNFPILTLGGKTHAGTEIRAAYNKDSQRDEFQVRVGSRWLCLGQYDLKRWYDFEVIMGEHETVVTVDGKGAVKIPTHLLRKISFGGLYLEPEWPEGMTRASDVQIDLSSISLKQEITN